MAKLVAVSALLLLLFTSLALSGPAKEQGRRGGKKKLSDKEHYNGDKHNAEYDHEAFLGKEQAKTFSELPPEEAKRRLGLIVDKIDTDGDGSVSEDELVVWIRLVSRRYVFDDRDRHWEFHVPDADQTYLSWDSYLEKSFGMIEDRTKVHDKGRNLTFNEIIDRYERRFKKADQDSNNLLDKDEFADFLHPHDVPHMTDIVVDETFQDIDKDRNGQITLTEYINDMSQSYTPEHKNWKEMETENFKTRRDRNGNGVLDREEVELWMFPPSVDPARNEAKHLFHHADLDKDKVLTKAEILDHQDVFVGSQATEHGKFFVRHDEF